ncbi:MAG TPA: hypothetical protein VIG29_15405, partial [Vicinamibacteria bacterium]
MALVLESLTRDLRAGLRSLARRPALFVLGSVTLAVGFAGNMTVFSLLEGLLLRPYPVPQLEELVLVREARADSPQERDIRIAPGDFLDL